MTLWDVSSGTEVYTLSNHPTEVFSIAFSPDGNLLASSHLDGTVKLWDITERRLAQSLYGHSGAVTSIAFSPDGRMLASGSRDGTVLLWAHLSYQKG